jgi:prolyl oligopeptidase
MSAIGWVVLVLMGCTKKPPEHKIEYPSTKMVDVVEDYHGTKIADPYRWMEDLDSKDVADWVAAQNKLTFAELNVLPMREHFKKRITELWDYPKTGIPKREGGRYFYAKNTGLQKQAPLYVRASLDAPPALVLDPNTLSPDGSLSLADWSPSPDGKWIAYGISEGGADWETLKVREVDTQKDLPDEVKWMRFSGISWTKDSKGFFYSRYPEPPKGKVLEAALSGQAVYYHRAGTQQSEDRLIYERKDLPTWFISGTVTEDGRYLLIFMQKGSDNNNRLYYSELGDPMKPNVSGPVKPLIEDDDAEFSAFANVGPLLFLRTDREAPNRKVIAVDVRDPKPASWKTIVPEGKEAIETVALIGHRIVVQYLADVRSRLSLFGTDGMAQGDIELPGTGTVQGMGGREDTPEVFFAFSSPLFPTTVFNYDPVSKMKKAFEAPPSPVDTNQFETKLLFATSKDGTKVPFFVTARKGIALDGSYPAMLYGYGGFSISMLPVYRPDVPAWLEMSGIWVTANMRGGAEYGEAWHKAGNLERKQNVFDDFIAVAEELIRQKYTSPGKLGIMGGSNGGLLVGAVEEQRPDLFGVALPAVGVMDMLRYDKFTGGRAWATEYGTSSDPKQFDVLIKYSPLHNVKKGTCYPPTLVTTADHDDRVVPSHSFKFTAAMQAAQSCGNPILIRVETEGSHGYRPTDKRIAEMADEWSFAAAHTGMTASKKGF